jgi:hypothetical protein
MVLLELYRSNDMHRDALQLLNRLVEESKSEITNIDFSKRFNPQMIIEYLRVLFFLLYYYHIQILFFTFSCIHYSKQ